MNASSTPDFHEPNRIVRMTEACTILGLSASTVRNRMKAGGKWSDPDFPKKIPLGVGSNCAKGWYIDDLHEYLNRKRG